MLKIMIAIAMTLISASAYAQFNKCGPGFCIKKSVAAPPPSCTMTGDLDLSICSNVSYVAIGVM